MAIVVSALAMAGFRDEGLASLTAFLTAPVGLGLLWVNARLFPLELELVALPTDPIDPDEENFLHHSAEEKVEDGEPTPAPWAPRLHTITPPITFAGVAITVLIAGFYAYHGWVAINAVVTRLTAPEREALSTGNLPIRVELGEDAIAVTSHSDVLWNWTLVVPMAGVTVVATVTLPPKETRQVWYNAFSSGASVTPRQVRTFARERLSATCEDLRGSRRMGNLR